MLLDSDAPLRFGNRADLVTDFLGRMDDVAIFEVALSQAQIAEGMNGDLSALGVGSSDKLRLDVNRAGDDANAWLSSPEIDLTPDPPGPQAPRPVGTSTTWS